jgi:hypothetical protein
MPFLAYFKEPEEVEDLIIDWRPYIGEDTIRPAGSTWPVEPPGGITVPEREVLEGNQMIRLRLEGGSHMVSYRFVNQIETTGGRRHTYDIVVYVEDTTPFFEGPPWTTVRDALEVQPSAQGESAVRVDRDLRRTARWIERWAPQPWPAEALLNADILGTERNIPVPKVEDWEYRGILKIENELIEYFGKETTSGAPTGAGWLTRARRGSFATNPAAHTLGTVLEDYEYPIAARDAVLAVFEWLWDTKGYIPSASSEAGSESFDTDLKKIKDMIKEDMGRFYTGAGRVTPVPMTSMLPRIPRTTRRHDWR